MLVQYTYRSGGGSGNRLHTVSSIPPSSLPSCGSSPLPLAPPVKATTIATGPFSEGMAQNWIAQNNLWQMIKLDTTYTDSSVALQQFATKAAGSRYGWLNNIAMAIMNGDKATAQTLLAVDIHAYVDTSIDTATGVKCKTG